jgi:CRISPR-associated endonuclease/helicase Cas3
VLVTTQVAEAGLNISAPVVLSELAPADSLIQRAGRCTRFQQDGHKVQGLFIVVKPEGDKAFLPYDKQLVAQTEEQLVSISGAFLDWETEKKLIAESLDAYYNHCLKQGRKPQAEKRRSKSEEEEPDGDEENEDRATEGEDAEDAQGE